MAFFYPEPVSDTRDRQKKQQHIAAIRRYFLILVLIIALFSICFHFLMIYEGQQQTWLSGVYWCLTVMTTLGFGDITFTTDLGRIFSVLVLLVGLVYFAILLPFTFMQHVYRPWSERQLRERVPHSLPPETKNHILIAGTDSIALNLASNLQRYGVRAILICDDTQTALPLIERGYECARGEYDDKSTYAALRADKASLLVTLDENLSTDVRSTNIVFSAREAAPNLFIVAGVARIEARDILRMAGCSRCFHFYSLLGEALGRRVIKASQRLSVLGHFGRIAIGEAPVLRTPLVDKTLKQSNLKNLTGVNVVGVWERGAFSLPRLDTVFTKSTILVVAGTEEQLEAFNRLISSTDKDPKPEERALILGGGRVGLAVARSLNRRGIPCTVVDRNGGVKVESGTRFVVGEASDLNLLEKAGIRTTPCIIVTTHDDDANIYLTLYTRRLRPDAQIISRASLDRNINGLHMAGADVVLSLSSLVSSTIMNLLLPDRLLMLNERLVVFCYTIHGTLGGKTLMESGIRARTTCSVLAVHCPDGRVYVNPPATYCFGMHDRIYLIGDAAAQEKFRRAYGMDSFTAAEPQWNEGSYAPGRPGPASHPDGR